MSTTRPWARRRRVLIALSGYVVVAVFAMTAGIAQRAGADATAMLVAGGIVAAPLLFALVGDRVTGLKAFAVEISLAEVAVAAEADFSSSVMRIAETGPSASPELLETFRSAVKSGSRVMRLNLQDGKYWWSTRLYLVAALADDYTSVDAIVFVQSGDERHFVGIASPRLTKMRVGMEFPAYELAYRKVRAEAAAPGPDADREVSEILTWRWPQALDWKESEVKVHVSPRDLKVWLRDALDDDPLNYGPLTPLLRYRILTRSARYAGLVDRSRLVQVVDAEQVARQSALAELERRLD